MDLLKELKEEKLKFEEAKLIYNNLSQMYINCMKYEHLNTLNLFNEVENSFKTLKEQKEKVLYLKKKVKDLKLYN
jgi:hypothetical protein